MLAVFCVLSENGKKTTTDSGDDINKIDFETETAPLNERRKVSVFVLGSRWPLLHFISEKKFPLNDEVSPELLFSVTVNVTSSLPK